MARTETIPWDPAEHLETREDVANYLEAALEDGDPRLLEAVLGDIARAKGMTKIAEEAGLGGESLDKVLSNDEKSGFSTVVTVLKAMGLRLSATAT